METYYKPEDLPKFEEIGKEAPNMAKKFFEYYAEVFKDSVDSNNRGWGEEGEDAVSNSPWPPLYERGGMRGRYIGDKCIVKEDVGDGWKYSSVEAGVVAPDGGMRFNGEDGT